MYITISMFNVTHGCSEYVFEILICQPVFFTDKKMSLPSLGVILCPWCIILLKLMLISELSTLINFGTPFVPTLRPDPCVCFISFCFISFFSLYEQHFALYSVTNDSVAKSGNFVSCLSSLKYIFGVPNKL